MKIYPAYKTRFAKCVSKLYIRFRTGRLSISKF